MQIDKNCHFETHPVQYHAPPWRYFAKRKGLDWTVHYFSDMGVKGGFDPGFGHVVTWDIPLLKGYKSVFLSRKSNLFDIKSLRIPDVRGLLTKGKFKCVRLLGYTNPFEWQVIKTAKEPYVKKPAVGTNISVAWTTMAYR